MPKNRRAITLIELLVVIGIVAILVMLLLPAVQLAREAGRKTTCQNNLRQTGIAIKAHETVKGTLPPGWSANAAGDTGWGWATFILPHLEQQYSSESAVGFPSDSTHEEMGGASGGPQVGGNLRQQRGGPPPWAGGPPPWAGGPPIEHAANKRFREAPVAAYLCPSDPAPKVFMLHARGGDVGRDNTAGRPHNVDDPRNASRGSPMFEVARANYAGVFGTLVIEDAPSDGDGVFFHNSRIRSANVRDGLSNTVFVGERSSRLGSTTWVGSVAGAQNSMARVVGRTGNVPNDVLGYFEDFSSHHVAGAHFLFGDGSVHILNDAIDRQIYRALATRSGGEVIDTSSLVKRRGQNAETLAVALPAVP